MPASYRDKNPPLSLPGFTHINRFWDGANETYAAKILPGQYYVTRNEESIVTVLGSCISACIRDKKSGVGGMNHFMLPMTSNEYSGKDVRLSDAARYGNYAMEMLINDILKNGGNKTDLEVKIFGGGKIIANMTDVGERNIEFAMDYLKSENLIPVASDIGLSFPRKVYYFPQSGKVKVKRLRSLHNNTIIERENSYLKEITTTPVSGEIDLF